MSDFKPGDVAMVVGHSGSQEIGYFDGSTWYYGSGSFVHGTSIPGPLVADVRPLVVIDPEDREQVERLYELYSSAPSGIGLRGSEFLQHALREFAKPGPPKPAEPTGLGAVVRDESGEIWVLAPTDGSPRVRHQRGEWVCSHSTGSWAAIDAVEVLSEGVTP